MNSRLVLDTNGVVFVWLALYVDSSGNAFALLEDSDRNICVSSITHLRTYDRHPLFDLVEGENQNEK